MTPISRGRSQTRAESWPLKPPGPY